MKTGFQTPGVWRAFGAHSMGLVVPQGRRVLFSGQIAWDEKRQIVGKGDMRAQTMQIFTNIQGLLAAVGGTMDDVVAIVTYVTTMEGLAAIHDVRMEFFSAPYPVSTLVAVSALVHPDLLIEITAEAVVPEERFHAPAADAPDSFAVSEGGFNLGS